MAEKLDSLGYPIGRGRDDLEMGAFLNVRVIRTASKLALLFQRQALRPNDLSVQDWRVLVNTAKLGDCHLRELSRIATIDPSHISRSTRKLEQRGLIRRDPDPCDRRRMRLSVTRDGAELVDRIWPMALDLNAQIEAEIGADRMAELNALLDATRQAVESRLADDCMDEGAFAEGPARD